MKEPGEYPELDENDTSREAHLLKQVWHENTLPSPPPPQRAVQFCPLPSHVRHLNWWLTNYFADHVDMLHMYAEVGNDELTKMQLKFLDSQNPSVFVTTPKVGGTGWNLTAANHAVITQELWVLNEKRQAFARTVRLKQNRVPQTCLLNTGPGGYDNWTSDLHEHTGVAKVRVLHGLMCWPSIRTSMIYQILLCYDDPRKRLSETGDTLQSDEWSLRLLKTLHQSLTL